jgi:hydroxyethylthiazole kinase
MINRIDLAIQHIKQSKPLVLCLTNYVTMDFMANCLLALGAAPIMSCDERELEELLAIAQAVTINLGTLDETFLDRCLLAAEMAKRMKKPLVLDPVGAGASTLRTQSARKLMGFADIIRGNASEIMALREDALRTRGVESTQSVTQAKDTALALSKQLGSTVVVSGVEDMIIQEETLQTLTFGSALMPLVTGMGCALTAVIAAFRAVVSDPFEASLLATAYFGLCGEWSHNQTNNPGTFRSIFIDNLHSPDFEAMRTVYA